MVLDHGGDLDIYVKGKVSEILVLKESCPQSGVYLHENLKRKVSPKGREVDYGG